MNPIKRERIQSDKVDFQVKDEDPVQAEKDEVKEGEET